MSNFKSWWDSVCDTHYPDSHTKTAQAAWNAGYQAAKLAKCHCDHHEHCSVCQPQMWVKAAPTSAVERLDAELDALNKTAPTQEPVGYMYENQDGIDHRMWASDCVRFPVYRAPPAAPTQEPIKDCGEAGHADGRCGNAGCVFLEARKNRLKPVLDENVRLYERIAKLEAQLEELKAAPTQGPVAWRANVDGVWFTAGSRKNLHNELTKACVDVPIEPLYTHPSDAAAQIAELNKALSITSQGNFKLREQIAQLTKERDEYGNALHDLWNACDDGDGGYGMLNGTFVRDVCKTALGVKKYV